MVETATLPVNARVEQTIVPPLLPIQRKGGFAKQSLANEAVFVARAYQRFIAWLMLRCTRFALASSFSSTTSIPSLTAYENRGSGNPTQ